MVPSSTNAPTLMYMGGMHVTVFRCVPVGWMTRRAQSGQHRRAEPFERKRGPCRKTEIVIDGEVLQGPHPEAGGESRLDQEFTFQVPSRERGADLPGIQRCLKFSRRRKCAAV